MQGPWQRYGGQAATAPAVIEGPPRQPPPQTPDQARRDAAEAVIAERTAAAPAAVPAGRLTDAQRNALRERLELLPSFDAQVDELGRLYRENFAGSGGGIDVGVANIGGGINLGGRVFPDWWAPQNERFRSAADSLIGTIAQIQGVTGGELNSLAELRARFGPMLPSPGDSDATIEDKLARLRQMAAEQRRAIVAQIPDIQPQNAPPAPGATPQSRQQGPIELGGGPDPVPPGAAQFRADLQEAINGGEFRTPEEIIAFGRGRGFNIDRGQAEAAIRAGRAVVEQPQFQVPDISDVRGAGASQERLMLENAVFGGAPIVGGAFQGITATTGPETGDAFRRGFYDVPTLGFADEARASVNAAFGEDFNASLARERAIDEYDTENNFGARLGGQVAGGFALPFPGAGLGRQALTSGAYGAAYGLGSGEGTGRGQNALTGAVIGAAVPPLLAGGGRVLGVTGPRAAERNALREAAQRQDIDLLRMDAGGVPTRMASGVIGRTPGGIPMAEGAERSIASAGRARDRIAGNIGTVADETGAGQAAQRGAKSFLGTSAERGQQLESRIPIAPGAPATVDSTRTTLGELTAGLASNPELGAIFRNPELERMRAALESGGLSWADLRRVRGLIGEQIEQPTVAGEKTSRAALRRLYGAMTQDMEATAAAAGPRTLTAFRRSQQFWRGRENRREGIIAEILGPNFDQGGARAFEQINRWAQRRGGNAANVGRLLRSLPPDEANTVRASIFARMGEASPGRQDQSGTVFSAAEFATQWHRLDERARAFLVPDRGHRSALNDLVRVATAMRRSSQFQNFSNTSLGTNAALFTGGMFVEPVSTISLALGSLAAGRFLASPVGARWLAASPRARSVGAARRHVGRLAAVAARDPAIAQEATGLQQVLTRAINDNFERQAAASETDQQQRSQGR